MSQNFLLRCWHRWHGLPGGGCALPGLQLQKIQPVRLFVGPRKRSAAGQGGIGARVGCDDAAGLRGTEARVGCHDFPGQSGTKNYLEMASLAAGIQRRRAT